MTLDPSQKMKCIHQKRAENYLSKINIFKKSHKSKISTDEKLLQSKITDRQIQNSNRYKFPVSQHG